jgi:hypothetical protein
VKQGIVLSVFSGPILGGLPGRVPTQSEFIRGLRQLYPNYPTNRNNTKFSNWPAEPFRRLLFTETRRNLQDGAEAPRAIP